MSKRNLCEVNLGDDNEFANSNDLMEYGQIGLKGDAFSQYKLQNPGYSDIYYDNARFIIHAQPPFAQKYCRCGMKNFFNRSGLCSIRRYCPRCAWAKAWKILSQFKDSFYRGRFFLLTLSYNGFVNFNRHYLDCLKY